MKMRLNLMNKFKYIAVSLTFMLSACGGEVPDLINVDDQPVDASKQDSIFGEDRLTFGGASKPKSTQPGSGIGVNAFLWRATLDTLSIWPIASADPFGGIIITDWYAPPETPNEKFKLNVFILDRALRADGVRVSVFRQVRTPSGEWRQAVVQLATNTKLENAILTRARQFRIESTDQ